MAAASFDDQDAERIVREPPKDPASGGDDRGAFQRDRARVLHSAAFRRLAAKTQVHTTGDDQFIRTRLTHSLEVAQIAREMGTSLGCDPDVVDTAGLAHDLGHPPFGHVGERALDAVSAACGGFEGNAQTLRVLTSLEAKIVAPDGRPAGLNLTRACLDAVAKYPWPRDPGRAKFGVYADDVPVYTWFRAGRPDGQRCLEAQVMDWADDVAYSVHDVEDGIHARLIALGPLRADTDERRALCADVAGRYSIEDPDTLEAMLVELLADSVFGPLDRYDGTHGAQIALKRLTSVLTGRFVAAAVAATRDRYGAGPHRRYGADLVVPASIRAQCALLKGMALRYVMRGPQAVASRTRQRELVRALVEVLPERAPGALDPMFAARWSAADDDATRLRVVIDQVASLTDPGAEAWYRRLVIAR
ncbi:MAG: deoxyguanosinetriphosphate triphosphohydrolase [Dactylosporangium sp.]|nr:deoxyguanosinetriphosphate triphosphohydrolase [Dactylosporangium sp.]NNJ60195.1 deoxyguanosinetriphosphate triphosphohydrolase [Dactylosporangium sp.]